MRNRTNHRSRWAAIGAAVAVTAGAGGLGIASATGSTPASYTAMSPCRLLDTRADLTFHVGNFTTLGPDSKLTAEGRGDHGQCSLPTTSIGLQLNVTAVDATAATYLTLYPGAGTAPNASHLNPTPGQPPAPNAVTVQLDDTGRFSIFNKNGAVDVIVDVVGTYAPAAAGGAHDHDDRYYTRAQIDATLSIHEQLAASKAGRQQSVLIPGSAFGPGNNTTTFWASPYDGAYTNVNFGILDAAVMIPAGSRVTAVTYHVRDSSASYNLGMFVRAAAQPAGTSRPDVSTATTSGSPGSTTITHTLATPYLIETGTAYFVRVTSNDWGLAAGDLRIKGVEIEYLLPM